MKWMGIRRRERDGTERVLLYFSNDLWYRGFECLGLLLVSMNCKFRSSVSYVLAPKVLIWATDWGWTGERG